VISNSEIADFSTLTQAVQTIGGIGNMAAALHAGLAGELENSLNSTLGALEQLLEALRRSRQPVDAQVAGAALELRGQALQLHLMLRYLAEFESGWASMVHTRRAGYTGTGSAAMTFDAAAVSLEA